MAIRKYMKVEESDVMSPEEHQELETNLHKVGKTSLADTTKEERQEILKDTLDNDQ
jgi:hypothetical protein